MNKFPYQYGQLLKVSDELHSLYCNVVRNGDVPPQPVSYTHLVLPEEDLYVDGEGDVLYLIDVPIMLAVEDGEVTDLYIDDVVEILNMAYYKTLFVPDDILCYINYSYFEETQETEDMKEFLRKAFFSGKNEHEEEAEHEIQFLMSEMNLIITGSTGSPTEDINETTEMFEEEGYTFDRFEQAQEFIHHYMNMSNNTRLPSNKGKDVYKRQMISCATLTIRILKRRRKRKT